MSLHFLRPEWLWALIPVIILLWFIFKHQLQQGNWQNIIEPSFQKVLFDDSRLQKKSTLPLIGLAIIWLISLVALAGPSWQQVKQPAEKIQQGTVIVLDTSLSMLGEDIKPSRMTRARYKLIDFLTANPHLSTGLVVYSGSAHVLSPISDDNSTIISLLPSINPVIMPSFGSDAVQAINKAVELLKQSRIKNGRIIWILDDIDEQQISTIKSLVTPSNIQLSLLAIGTKKGAPISVPEHGLLKDEKGKIIISRLPTAKLETLADSLNARLIYMTNDNSDIKSLATEFALGKQKTTQKTNSQQKDKPEKTMASWLDNGIYLLLPLALLIGFSYRRGWVLSWVVIWTIMFPPLLGFSPTSYAEEAAESNTKSLSKVNFLDFFKSSNQQGYESWQQQDYKAANNKLESPQWKGSSYYRLQEFTKAEKQFELDKSPTGRFNQANSLAKQGQFADAQKQLEKALQLNPSFKQAEKNLQIIKQIIAKQQQKKQNQQSQQGKGQNKEQQQDKDGQQKKPRNGPKDDSKSESKSKQQHNEDNKKKQDNKQSDKKNSKKSSTEEGKKPGKNGKDSDKPATKKQANKAEQDKKSGKKPDKSNQQDQATNNKATTKKDLTEAEQAQKAWLNQIPDEPGLFLKNKFEYQYQQQKSTTKQGKIW
jgi:Ca-activated chloride channel family protein